MFPSPEFLSSLAFTKKFYPVLNLLVTSLALYEYAPAFTLCSLVLYAPRVPQKQRGCSLLHLLAIRTRCTPSVRKFALPIGARVESVISNMNEYFVPIGHMKALYLHLISINQCRRRGKFIPKSKV